MIRVSLRSHIQVKRASAASLIVGLPGRRLRLADLSAEVHEMLQVLGDGPLMWDANLGGLSRGDIVLSEATVEAAMTELTERRLIRIGCSAEGRELAEAEFTGGSASFSFSSQPENQRLRLSRFVYLRNLSGSLVIESPRQFLRVRLLAPEVMSLMTELARGETVASLYVQNADCSKEIIRESVRFLLGAGVVDVLSREGELPEDIDPDLAPREFHDVAFHNAIRQGLTDNQFGARFPFLGVLQPTPALKPLPDTTLIPLPVPDLDALIRDDPPLSQVMEQRRSLRSYGTAPITLSQLGEFLYRVARVRSVITANPSEGILYDATSRTYPSGGATYDLELYLTIRQCAGIDPGMYHYEPGQHAFSLVSNRPGVVSSLLENARRQSGQEETPPVLITFASRFNRLCWKYRGISYATTLKNVGVLYEAMYLAATVMGLAACALGCGDSFLFSRATGLKPMAESSVGEFAIGPLRREDRGGALYRGTSWT